MDRTEYQTIVIQDIINLNKTGELNIAPWYQRRSVWNISQKSYLINTLLEQKPMPAIYVRHSLDLEKEKSIKEIVDGQQRIRSILEYCKDEFLALHPKYQKKVKFSDLKPSDRQKFLLTSLSIGYLLGATDEDVIDIFGRINSVSKTLNSQEKRNADYSGEFKQFCLKYAALRVNFWKNYNIFSANQIARMQEVNFISDVVINLMEGLTDYSEAKINKYYEKYDDSFASASTVNKKLNKIFGILINVDPNTIKETIFKRQPILFSLIVVLNDNLRIGISKVEQALMNIDEIYNTDKPYDKRDADEINFLSACKASTQRITQRKIRDKFIRKFIR
jgi:hypothetical protein